MKEWDGWKLC